MLEIKLLQIAHNCKKWQLTVGKVTAVIKKMPFS